jgi:hypothetical protein
VGFTHLVKFGLVKGVDDEFGRWNFVFDLFFDVDLDVGEVQDPDRDVVGKRHLLDVFAGDWLDGEDFLLVDFEVYFAKSEFVRSFVGAGFAVLADGGALGHFISCRHRKDQILC